VLVEGRLRQRSWETDGVKRSKIEVVADNVQFLGGPRGASAETGAPTAPAPESQDDDIPF
jgi:single-strand DNA-binding protein